MSRSPELRGSTLGILGYGSIGREVARLAQVKVIISEFMASNDATTTDQFGLSSDWIELFNTAATNIM